MAGERKGKIKKHGSRTCMGFHTLQRLGVTVRDQTVDCVAVSMSVSHDVR